MESTWFHPVIDVESEPFWNGCLENRLMIMRCERCRKNYFYPRAHCPFCWSADTHWIEASGRGKLHSFSILHQHHAEPFASRVPYATIIVALDEGPHMLSNWDFNVPLEQMVCDLPVKVRFFRVADKLAIPLFGPA